MKKLRPVNGQIIVKPSEPKDKSAGGIFLPDTAKEKLQKGKVIATAKDATEEVAVGDYVIFKEFSGTEVDIENENHILLTEDDLLVKYEDVDKIPE